MTPSGIEPATLRLVPHCLNQLRHAYPIIWQYGTEFKRNMLLPLEFRTSERVRVGHIARFFLSNFLLNYFFIIVSSAKVKLHVQDANRRTDQNTSNFQLSRLTSVEKAVKNTTIIVIYKVLVYIQMSQPTTCFGLF